MQPFVCTTCGAQKLRDETVKALEAEVKQLRLDAEEMQERCAKVCDEFAKKYAIHAERKTNDPYKVLVCNGVSAAIRALKVAK
jgi:hypothetical protein